MIPHNVKLVEERCAIAFQSGETYLVETYPDFYLVNDNETEKNRDLGKGSFVNLK